MNHQLIGFYAGEQPDNKGRYISDILNFTPEELEYTHDYIQWLFPNKEPSEFNLDAPVLDDETIEEFKKNPVIIRNIGLAHQKMLSFYTFRKNVWAYHGDELFMKNNHNFLRMTRIITFLALVNQSRWMASFCAICFSIYGNFADVNDESFKYWLKAATLILEK